MSTLLLTNSDLDLTANSFTVLSDPLLETVQRLSTKFRFWLGEWFLNTNAGIDYLGKVLVKSPNLRTVRTIFRQTIRQDEGIDTTQPITVTLALDRTTRKLSVSYSATTLTGEPLNVKDFVLTTTPEANVLAGSGA